MYVWFNGRRIKNSFIEFLRIENYVEVIKDLSHDQTVPKYATNLVFLTKANHVTDIESKIIYSILNKHPKRADLYWMLHVDILDEPLEYKITHIIPGTLIKVDFKIGFKVQPRVNLFFRQVLEEMSRNNEIDMLSHYASLRKHFVSADFTGSRIMTSIFRPANSLSWTFTRYSSGSASPRSGPWGWTPAT
jgi:KUP system potassium uptake protein